MSPLSNLLLSFIMHLTVIIVMLALASAGSIPIQQMSNPQSNRLNNQQLSIPTTSQLHHLPVKSASHATHPVVQTIQLAQSNNLNNPYTMATHALLLDLRQQLINRAMKFDEHFRNLLSTSKISLHNMFVDTYGDMYQRNSEIFTSMYESLEQYYATGQIQLTKSMQEFFVKLYQKIFQAFNMNRVFTPEYMACATEQLEHLKPFKDAPEKLISEIRHAFVAARTFNQALNSSIDVIKNIILLGQPTQCTNLINDRLLRHIGSINNQPNGQVPCLGYCEQVISRCVGRSNLDQMSERWRAYVASLSELAKKLSVHYNIETIIAPLDVQISEAIMNFQENATNITEQVSRACGPSSSHGGLNQKLPPASHLSSSHHLAGKPSNIQHQNRLGKRAAPAPASVASIRNRHAPPRTFHQPDNLMPDEAGSSFDSSSFGQTMTMGINKNLGLSSGTESSSSSLHNLGSNIVKKRPIIIEEIRDFMLSTKWFWSNLPNAVCTNNGSSNASMLMVGPNSLHTKVILSRKPPQCFEEHLSLSDMNTDLRYRTEIQQQIQRLSAIQVKIADAIRGVEIDWSNPSTGQQLTQNTASTQGLGPSIPVGNTSNQAPRLPGVSTGPHHSSPAPAATTSGDDENDEEDDAIEPGSGDGNSKTDTDASIFSGNSGDDSSTTDDSDYHDGDDTGLDSTPNTNDDSDYSSPPANNNNSDNDEVTTHQPASSDLGNTGGDQQLSGSNDNYLDNTSSGNALNKNPVNLDIPNDLITAPGAQRSGASASHTKLLTVISSFDKMLLLMVSISLLHVTSRQGVIATLR